MGGGANFATFGAVLTDFSKLWKGLFSCALFKQLILEMIVSHF